MKLFPDIAVRYVRESGNIRTKHSRDSYRKVLRLLQSTFPDKRIQDFTIGDLTHFCISRFDGKEGQAAPSTQKNRRAHVRSTFEWAQWKGFIKYNPALELKFTVRPGNGQVRTGTWLDKEECVKVAALLDTDDIVDRRNRVLFLIGVLCGLRRFELAGLTWDQFNEGLTELKVKGKGDQIDVLGVPPELTYVLETWRHVRQMGGTAVLPSFKWVMHPVADRRVQIISWDTPLGEAGVGYVVAGIGERIGRKLDPHDLRRSFFGMLEAEGLQLKDIQRAGRHKNVATTDRYLEKNPARTVALTKEFRLGI